MSNDPLKNAAEYFRNKDSFFNKNILPALKVLNALALVFFAITISSNLDMFPDLKINFTVYAIIFALSPIIANIIVSGISSNHKFFEWDKHEREKKSTFLFTLIPIVFFFTYLSVFLITTSIFYLRNIDFETLDRPAMVFFILRPLGGIILLLNAIFSVELHYGVYSSSLTLDEYRLAKKPDNWDWERTSQDDINDAYGR